MTDVALHVLIASPLEDEHVARIAAVDPRVRVLHAPELLPTPRYVADHTGERPRLTQPALDRWVTALGQADVMFDFDWWAPADMPSNCPRLKWVQATSAGIGSFLRRTGLADTDIHFTTAAGTHAVPLAEFALLGLLYFVKGLPSLRQQQAEHHWERYTTSQLAGRRVGVVGLGGIGRRVVDVFTALGVEVWGVGRPGRTYDSPGLSQVIGFPDLDNALPCLDAIVLCCPLTEATEGLLGERQLRLLPRGAVVVNVARGAVVDETALVRALQERHLAGACLDVFATEPLPDQSPLWDLDNVIVSPHSASTVDAENEILTDLFCDNLRRWLDGRPLRNLYSRENNY